MLILFYDLADDYLERRAPLREEHLGMINAAHARGELALAGALDNPMDRAVLVWSTDDPAVVEAFVQADPYVRAGLIRRWEIRQWNQVVGSTP